MKSANEIVMTILNEFAEDWGLDDIEIADATQLKTDLGFESADTMQFFAAIQENYLSVKFQFQDLVMDKGSFVKDLNVADVIAFVAATLKSSAENVTTGDT